MKLLLERLKNNAQFKKIAHWMMIPSGEARPRLWIKWFVNPFFHKHKKGSKIRYRTRMDVLPFNLFEIGKKAVIEDFSVVNNGVGAVIIGDETLVGMSNVIIGPVTIGNHVITAQNVVMSGLNHEYQDISIPISQQKVTTKPIKIDDECWIGANVVITAGVNIGKHSVIGAGSVVTKDIPPYSVALGNPAKIIKTYDPVSNSWVNTRTKSVD
ncbi:acyltransferase [Pedobacter metabolipauper]|uniref:Acetyltransferase-like isoleucine patch superfamily enzyme n=1 Tax=Pedobacter metabolipauper TaxID=425513 RepID=A0A4V3D1P7_9SPHI|nr:acyltransferase [Pedobacter metabolipauper]TDQ12013.1 acetyltransferase-like isoleucine patch superfamily enzyme [Pedobacter metabolipauper]